MKALSIKQPWAWAIFHGKPIENRTWSTDYRGPLLIHASGTFDWEGFGWLHENQLKLGILIPPPGILQKSVIVGRVNLVDCVKEHPSPYFFGPYGFVFEDPVLCGLPIPYKGQQGIFEVPDKVIFRRIEK